MAKSSKLNSVSLGTTSRPSGTAMRGGEMGEALEAIDGALVEIESTIDVSAKNIVLTELSSAPDAPGAGTNKAIIYAVVSDGNTRLMVQFQLGAPQEIEIEP